MIEEVNKDYHYGHHGSFRLELINFEVVIHALFERANGFNDEPNHINRNYLHHGMSKRSVLRKDCVKLFLVYDQALRFPRHLSKTGGKS